MRAAQIVEAGVVQCPEGRKLFPQMSVLKNLMLGAYVHRRDTAGNKKRLDEVLALFPILDQKKDDPRRFAVGWPAADGGHRPRDDEPSEGAAARRAVAASRPSS